MLSFFFPGCDFPKSFPSTVKHVYRQLLRVFAHIYHSHFQQILHLRSEPHFNSLFAHFLSFGREYELLEIKDVSGVSSAPVGIGQLWEKWREMGILEAWDLLRMYNFVCREPCQAGTIFFQTFIRWSCVLTLPTGHANFWWIIYPDPETWDYLL
jgi:hypothetical protein